MLESALLADVQEEFFSFASSQSVFEKELEWAGGETFQRADREGKLVSVEFFGERRVQSDVFLNGELRSGEICAHADSREFGSMDHIRDGLRRNERFSS